MNDRIKQLAAAATENILGVNILDQQKFAELIIQECCQVGGPEDSYTDEWFKAKVNSVAKIKEHFGVRQ